MDRGTKWRNLEIVYLKSNHYYIIINTLYLPYQNQNTNYTRPNHLNAQKSLEGIAEHQHH